MTHKKRLIFNETPVIEFHPWDILTGEEFEDTVRCRYIGNAELEAIRTRCSTVGARLASEVDAEAFYKAIAVAAVTGWDFSTADGVAVPCTPETVGAMPEWFRDQIVARCRGENRAADKPEAAQGASEDANPTSDSPTS